LIIEEEYDEIYEEENLKSPKKYKMILMIFFFALCIFLIKFLS